MSGPPHHPQEDRQLPRGLRARAGLPPQGRQDRHRGPVHDLHRVRDDHEPAAKNARYARAHGFDGLVCRRASSCSVAFSQTVEDVSENARANLEYIDMRFGAPVYVGDTIEVETKVLGVTHLVLAPEPRRRARADHRAQERRRARRGDRADLAAQGAGLQGRRRGRGRTRGEIAPDADRLPALAAALRPGPRLPRARASLERRTPTSRTSSPARASSTRAAAP